MRQLFFLVFQRSCCHRSLGHRHFLLVFLRWIKKDLFTKKHISLSPPPTPPARNLPQPPLDFRRDHCHCSSGRGGATGIHCLFFLRCVKNDVQTCFAILPPNTAHSISPLRFPTRWVPPWVGRGGGVGPPTGGCPSGNLRRAGPASPPAPPSPPPPRTLRFFVAPAAVKIDACETLNFSPFYA